MTTLIQPKVDENRVARAPYNFIPLPEKVITLSVDELPDQGVYDPKRHTGYIDCELTTSSPVYVRAGLTPDQVDAGKESKDLPDFFYLDNKNQPVIPGSSLRGLVRTLVEIVTFSKIGAVSETPLVYRSVGGTTNHDENYRAQMMKSDNKEYKAGDTKLYTPNIRGGYMVQVGTRDWAIRPAKVFDGTTYAHIGMSKYDQAELKQIKGCRNAYEIFIKVGPYQYQDVKEGFLKVKFAKVADNRASAQPGFLAATLAISGPMFSKKSEAVIFEPDEKADLLHITDDQIDNYILQRSKEQEKLLGKDGVLVHGQPVFYLLDEKTSKVLFFGHARMFRVPYQYSPLEFVPDYARPTDEPKDPSLVDFAEAMFGYTRKNGEGKQRAYAGRISFTDAILKPDQKDIWLSQSPIKPRILASPKPTTFQHYLVQPEPNYYASERAKPDTRLVDYDSAPNRDTAIRGHKFYWHKGEVGIEDIRQQGKVKDTQLTEIHPLKADVKFKFKVRFENLTTEELGALMWIFDQSAKEHMRLKIGMGKPLGMGAVAIKPNLFIQDPKIRHSKLLADGKWADGHLRSNDLAVTALEKFSKTILDELNKDLPSDEKLAQFAKSPHISGLLAMLQWPGLDREWTRYMEIEYPDPKENRGKRNEYRDRPVLPSPISVLNKHKS